MHVLPAPALPNESNSVPKAGADVIRKTHSYESFQTVLGHSASARTTNRGASNGVDPKPVAPERKDKGRLAGGEAEFITTSGEVGAAVIAVPVRGPEPPRTVRGEGPRVGETESNQVPTLPTAPTDVARSAVDVRVDTATESGQTDSVTLPVAHVSRALTPMTESLADAQFGEQPGVGAALELGPHERSRAAVLPAPWQTAALSGSENAALEQLVEEPFGLELMSPWATRRNSAIRPPGADGSTARLLVDRTIGRGGDPTSTAAAAHDAVDTAEAVTLQAAARAGQKAATASDLARSLEPSATPSGADVASASPSADVDTSAITIATEMAQEILMEEEALPSDELDATVRAQSVPVADAHDDEGTEAATISERTTIQESVQVARERSGMTGIVDAPHSVGTHDASVEDVATDAAGRVVPGTIMNTMTSAPSAEDEGAAQTEERLTAGRSTASTDTGGSTFHSDGDRSSPHRFGSHAETEQASASTPIASADSGAPFEIVAGADLSTSLVGRAVTETQDVAAADRSAFVDRLADHLHDIVETLTREPASGRTEQVAIRLRPNFLGQMLLRVSVDDTGTVNARFIVDNAAVRTLIEQDIGQLRASLDEHGLSLGEATVDAGFSSEAGADGSVPFEDMPKRAVLHEHAADGSGVATAAEAEGAVAAITGDEWMSIDIRV